MAKKIRFLSPKVAAAAYLCAAEHDDGLDLPVRRDPPDEVVVADVDGAVGAGRHRTHAQEGPLLGHPVAARGVATERRDSKGHFGIVHTQYLLKGTLINLEHV